MEYRTNTSTIGKMIRKYRDKAGITQVKLGELISKSESTIRKYESGKIEPPISIVIKIVEELNIPREKIIALLDTKGIGVEGGMATGIISDISKRTLIVKGEIEVERIISLYQSKDVIEVNKITNEIFKIEITYRVGSYQVGTDTP